MEVAFDFIAIDIALRKRSRPMRALVIDDAKTAVEIEHGQREPLGFDLQRRAVGNVVSKA